MLPWTPQLWNSASAGVVLQEPSSALPRWGYQEHATSMSPLCAALLSVLVR